MTSTVLDVTMLLLCVSASVMALGAVDSDREAAGPEATEIADLIATETVTVTYASAEAPNGTRTVHATRAELLALVAAGSSESGGRSAHGQAFASEALSVIERGLGPRTRIDVEIQRGESDGADAGGGNRSRTNSPGSAGGSPGLGSNASTPLTGPIGWIFDSDGSDRDPTGAPGTGLPWRIDRRDRDSGVSEPGNPAAESESVETVTVGSEPPRGVDITVAVITHPAPNDSNTAEKAKIVVRRW